MNRRARILRDVADGHLALFRRPGVEPRRWVNDRGDIIGHSMLEGLVAEGYLVVLDNGRADTTPAGLVFVGESRDLPPTSLIE